MPKLKRVVPSLEQVPEQYQDLYVESEDGNFVLDDDGDERVAAKNRQLLAENRKLKDRTKGYDGIDPEEARKAMDRLAELDAKKAEEAGEWTKLREQMAKQHATELADRDQRISKRENFIHRLVAENEVNAVIGKHGANGRILRPIMLPNIRVEEHEGGFVTRIMDGAGNPALASGSGDYMNVEQYFESLMKDPELEVAFPARNRPGAGAPARTADRNGGESGKSRQAEVVINGPEDLLRHAEAIAKGEVKVVGASD